MYNLVSFAFSDFLSAGPRVNLSVILFLVLTLVCSFLEYASLSRVSILFANTAGTKILAGDVLFLILLLSLSSVSRIALLRIQSNIAVSTAKALVYRFYYKYFSAESLTRSEQQPSFLSSSILFRVNTIISGVYLPLLSGITSSCVSVFIVIAVCLRSGLLFMPPVAFIVFSYVFASFSAKRSLLALGSKRLQAEQAYADILKDIPSVRQFIFSDLTTKETISLLAPFDLDIRSSTASIFFISSFPRYVVELVTLPAIIFTVYFLSSSSSSSTDFLAKGSVIVFGVIRLIPSLQSVFLSLSSMRSSTPSFVEINSLINR